jgi:plastocyanin
MAISILALVALGCGGGGAPTAAPSAGASPTPAAVACNASGSGTAATIADFAFNPDPITVAVGERITWTNNDNTAHTVSFEGGPDCGNLGGGASQTVQFNVAGSFPYLCKLHGNMTGTVTVN